jgi:hypothetical protein
MPTEYEDNLMKMTISCQRLMDKNLLRMMFQSVSDIKAMESFLLRSIDSLESPWTLPEDRELINGMLTDFLLYSDLPDGVDKWLRQEVRKKYADHVRTVFNIHEKMGTQPSRNYVDAAAILASPQEQIH